MPATGCSMRKANLGCALGCALALSGIAAAAEPAVDARALGRAESILNYCSRVDPSAAAKLHEKVDLLLHGLSTAAAAHIRGTNEYRAAYESVSDFVGKVDPHNAKRPCSAALTPAAGPPTSYLPDRFAGRAGRYYRILWGVDSLSVKTVESGEIIRFAWRVLDADKARVLNEKASEPSLIDPQAGVQLVVPSIEQIGQLRQSVAPESGKSYWMAFSNKGRRVKRGDRVNVVIGPFRAEGLVVD